MSGSALAAFLAAAVFSSCYSSDSAASFCQRYNRHMSARSVGTSVRDSRFVSGAGGYVSGELTMTKTALVSLAVLTLSASVAMAAQHKTHRHAVKPSAAAAPASPAVGASPVFWTGGVSSADREMYIRNQRDSGLAGKR